VRERGIARGLAETVETVEGLKRTRGVAWRTTDVDLPRHNQQLDHNIYTLCR
jgi:hypothetical protein